MSDCLFCGIIEGKIRGELVYQDDSVVAFKDIGPKAPVHILIVPRKHIPTLLDLEPSDGPLVGEIFRVAAKLAAEQGIAVRHEPGDGVAPHGRIGALQGRSGARGALARLGRRRSMAGRRRDEETADDRAGAEDADHGAAIFNPRAVEEQETARQIARPAAICPVCEICTSSSTSSPASLARGGPPGRVTARAPARTRCSIETVAEQMSCLGTAEHAKQVQHNDNDPIACNDASLRTYRRRRIINKMILKSQLQFIRHSVSLSEPINFGSDSTREISDEECKAQFLARASEHLRGWKDQACFFWSKRRAPARLGRKSIAAVTF